MEGAEVIMWLVMRGALSANVRKMHQSYYLPSMTGIATAIYENQASAPIAGERRSGIARHIGRAAAPASRSSKARIRSRSSAACKAYRLNKFLHG